MNKNAIKKFAIEARKKLIASVSDRAGMLGITPEGCSEPITRGMDFEVYKTVAGTEVTLNKNQCRQRRKLQEQIEARGFESVVEEVAYTWFNRICAIRFMEVNDYLPTRVRVLSSEKEGKSEPDIVTQAPAVDLDFTDKEHEYILDCKMNNKLDELFKMLFIKQCNKLSELLPELFEATEDYTEMLLNISYTNNDDVVNMLVNKEAGIPEKYFRVSTVGEDGEVTGQVEIIGWLYQYYNTELKDDTFAKLKKNIKISKERIPAATQLFTPDWIVRYMVENSVGRLWIEHLRAVDPEVDEKETAEKFGWKYYLPEAEQEADVNVKLAEIRTSYKDLKPEDITCIDPCMGSGHILVAMFDVLMDIYKSAGYSERDAAFDIVEHNIHGLDIDKRAYQLAYFAVMMKGRGYNRRFLNGKTNEQGERKLFCPKVYVIEESNDVNRQQLKYFGVGLNFVEKNNAQNQIIGLLDDLRDAKEYGSIIKVDNYDWDLLRKFVSKESSDGQLSFDTLGIDETQSKLKRLISIGKAMAQTYDAVVTNPPYMGIKNMSPQLANYIRKNYPENKYDLYGIFIEKTLNMLCEKGILGTITQQTFMFLSRYEYLRRRIIINDIINLIQLGTKAFEEIGGEVVQTATYIVRRSNIKEYQAKYLNLCSYDNAEEKHSAFFEKKSLYVKRKDKFDLINGCPLAYWTSDRVGEIFNTSMALDEIAFPRQGMATSDNDRFLRLWFEVNKGKVGFGYKTRDAALKSGNKWFPYNKGGGYRKWFGNAEYVVDWENDGEEIKRFRDYKNSTLDSNMGVAGLPFIFKENITWSKVCSAKFSVRYLPEGFLFDVSGCSIYAEQEKLKYMMALLNSNVMEYLLSAISQSLNFEVGSIKMLPVIEKGDFDTNKVDENVCLAKQDWDSFETSWDFMTHPFIRCTKCGYEEIKHGKQKYVKDMNCIEESYNRWSNECRVRFKQLKENEEELNRFFIEIYGLQEELIPKVEEKDVTVRNADLQRDIKSFISYAVGCMFGRYSLDTEGLIYAGGEWDESNYSSFIPDIDNVIPITDEEYFLEDIIGRFCQWLKVVYGEETLEDNLDFIAKALGNKGDTSRDVIRNYFLNDFMTDHLKIYQKRPIYWMFDSGKANGFKALVYLHRYNQDTVGTVRTEYLHKTQKAIEQAMQRAEYVKENGSGSEKAKATKQITKYIKQLAEIKFYDEAMAHIANQRIALDLDDGVKVNYEKFQGVEVAQEGKKALKIDLLAKIK